MSRESPSGPLLAAAFTATPQPDGPWWRQLNLYHWFVFAVASMAWLFDCLDQQLFILARNSAITALSPHGMDPVLIKEAGTRATAIFVAGWALGGLIFGSVGDRIGRAKTLTLTVLLYSLFTGLSAFATSVSMFEGFRFLTGLGVGGVFGLAVALLADSLPDHARPHALGLLQALSAVGNVTAGGVAIIVGHLETYRIAPGSAWRWMFLIGALPAFLCVFIQMRLKEPEKWVAARAAGRISGVRFGSYAALLGDKRWRGHALIGMVMCISGVIGLWGIGFFSPELTNDVIGRALKAEGVQASQQPGYRMMWGGISLVFQNIGAFAGMLGFSRLASRYGRKPAFAVAYLGAMLTTILVFQFLNQRADIFWMIPLMGFFQLSLFAGFAIYLPELFPISLRSTGVSFCYNVGRFIAAVGPLFMGRLATWLATGATTPEQKLQAFRNACGWMSCIFLLGLFALLFAPETKGRPMPED
jgi:MFS family permease